ncbi:MAG: hypothetical protein V3S11_04485, partial [Elusimicrobiota bacterium]
MNLRTFIPSALAAALVLALAPARAYGAAATVEDSFLSDGGLILPDTTSVFDPNDHGDSPVEKMGEKVVEMGGKTGTVTEHGLYVPGEGYWPIVGDGLGYGPPTPPNYYGMPPGTEPIIQGGELMGYCDGSMCYPASESDRLAHRESTEGDAPIDPTYTASLTAATTPEGQPLTTENEQGGIPTCGPNPTTYCVPPKEKEKETEPPKRETIVTQGVENSRERRENPHSGDTLVVMGQSPNNTVTGGGDVVTPVDGQEYIPKDDTESEHIFGTIYDQSLVMADTTVTDQRGGQYLNTAQSAQLVEGALNGKGSRDTPLFRTIEKLLSLETDLITAIAERFDPNGFLPAGAKTDGFSGGRSREEALPVLPFKECVGVFGDKVHGN